MAFLIKPGQRVVFIGDSVTDCGRRGGAAPLGDGYVRVVNDLINAKYPGHNVTVTNLGIGGNTVKDLYNRWADELLPRPADWISIAIGINDLHRHANKSEPKLTFDDFVDYYTRLLEWTQKESKAKLVIMDPFYTSQDTHEGSFRAMILSHMPAYLEVTAKLAKKHKAVHVKTQAMFMEHLKHTTADRLAPDAVHPTPTGHLYMAHAWLKAMGW